MSYVLAIAIGLPLGLFHGWLIERPTCWDAERWAREASRT